MSEEPFVGEININGEDAVLEIRLSSNGIALFAICRTPYDPRKSKVFFFTLKDMLELKDKLEEMLKEAK